MPMDLILKGSVTYRGQQLKISLSIKHSSVCKQLASWVTSQKTFTGGCQLAIANSLYSL